MIWSLDCETDFLTMLGDGFEDFLFSSLFGEIIQNRLIFFNWVETTN